MEHKRQMLSYVSPYHGHPGVCQLDVWHVNGICAWIVITEIMDNPGPSITNAMDSLIDSINGWATFQRLKVDPAIWVERYNSKSYEGMEGNYLSLAQVIPTRPKHKYQPLAVEYAIVITEMMEKADGPVERTFVEPSIYRNNSQTLH